MTKPYPYHEKMPDIATIDELLGGDFDSYITKVLTPNATSTIIKTERNGVIQRVYAERDVHQAAQVIRGYRHNKIHGAIGQGDPTETEIAALNTLIEYNNTGKKFLYFEKDSPSYDWIVNSTPNPNGDYVKRPVMERAVIDKAIGLDADKKGTFSLLSFDEINRRRELLANDQLEVEKLLRENEELGLRFGVTVAKSCPMRDLPINRSPHKNVPELV